MQGVLLVIQSQNLPAIGPNPIQPPGGNKPAGQRLHCPALVTQALQFIVKLRLIHLQPGRQLRPIGKPQPEFRQDLQNPVASGAALPNGQGLQDLGHISSVP